MASKIPDSHNFDEQFLTCPVCMLHFRDPRVLPCLHTFCKECLQEWAAKQQPLECPTCRTRVSLPDQGVDRLRTNFYVNNLLDFAAVKEGVGPGVPCQVCEGTKKGARSWCVQCAVLLCESCTNTHRRFPTLKGHQIVTQENLEASEGVPGTFQRKAFCPKHEDQVLTFYCEPCQTLVCVACTVVDHRPGDKHNPVEIGSVAERKKRDLRKLMNNVEPREKDVQATLKQLERELSEFPTSADAAIEQATAYFDQLMALLQDRKEEVVSEIESRRQEVGKGLEAQKEAIEFELAGLTSASEFCKKKALEHGSDVHVIEVEGQARQRVEELMTTPSDLTARPSQVVFSEGTAVAEFRDDVARAGCVQVRHTGKVDASKCTVDIKPAVLEFPNVCLLSTVDKNGQPCSVLKDDVTATLMDPSGQAVPTQLQEKGRGLWEISYSPEVIAKGHGQP
ncbi:tripartite motif-containing protein 2-like [Branchiostoma floridae]|uniref:Tripartite motif-containing protein 2-like n=1 Tax=Branchiostoma floridae TaxID=7739 RepID=A0A9J7MCW6_BRAFL|nr:tripartite motif-containing protein 2-like [Branchiostoma floridae]